MDRIYIREMFSYTTNFTTFIDQNNYEESISRKRNSKAHRNDLLHVGLWLLTDSQGIPLLHGTYEANKNDVKVFDYFLGYIRRFREFTENIQDITMIFGKGNNNEDNTSGIKYHYIGALRPSTQKEILRITLGDYKKQEEGIMFLRTTQIIYGKDYAIVITYNPALAHKKENSLLSKIERCKKYILEYIENANRSKRKRNMEKIRIAIDGYLKTVRMVGFINKD